ncbi:Aste57867_4796 [Aphanomyces stellatus]|uniref:Aste57867_4796 protein n=1 Tax=Aphanomyces stellatus TaxID=120398 RepID=A0A485KGX2_9STRA|nr:hypothetical protein As57867_004783 [Aphanomyces stellatus]VFT81891.1 Aste57867_4796 [Aphanomyces stellatus]
MLAVIDNVPTRSAIGEGRPFSVKIEANEIVSELKKMIKEEKMYTTFPADALELYLALKDGAWLSDEDPNLEGLSQPAEGNTVTPKYVTPEKWMKPARKLSKFFSGGEYPAFCDDERIHVLVVRPEGAVASETSATAQMVKEMHEQIVQTKRKRYVHSQVGSSNGKKLLQDLKIQVEPWRTVPFATAVHTTVEAFKWESVRDGSGQNIALTEEQQRERYRAYVEYNIGEVLAEKELCVISVEKGQDILTVLVPGHDIELAGRTDLLVLSDLVKDDPSDLQFLPGVKMLIEVKKAIKPDSVFQALSELIALDLLAKDPVMALMTDLTDNWQFFWVSEMCDTHVNIHKSNIKKPGEAFQISVFRALKNP